MTKQLKPIIHGRDHEHGSADPVQIAWEDVGSGGAGGGGIIIQDEGVDLPSEGRLNFIGAGVTATDNAASGRTDVTIPGGGGGRDPAAWQDLVDTYGPRFEWVFQDDESVDNQWDDVTGHSHPLGLPAAGTGKLTRSTTAHMFAWQTYSGKCTGGGSSSYASATPGGSWAYPGQPFTLEVWYRISSSHQGALLSSDNSSTDSNHWSVGFDSSYKLVLRRYGSSVASGVAPALNEWCQYLVTSDGSQVSLYLNGGLVGQLTEPAASSPGSTVIVAREQKTSGPATYAYLDGYYGAVVGYDTALTATQVWELYQAGLASGNTAETSPPSNTGPPGPAGPAGLPTVVQDEGTALTARTALNFTGAGVTAADDAANNRTNVTIPGGGGGGGAWTLLTTVTLASPGSFDVTGISGGYNDLILVLILRSSTAATTEAITVKVNNDSASNYYMERIQGFGNASITAAEALATPGWTQPTIVAANATAANGFAVQEWTFYGYASTTWLKYVITNAVRATDGSGTHTVEDRFVGWWNSTAAINRLTVTTASAANFVTGSQLRLYGRL